MLGEQIDEDKLKYGGFPGSSKRQIVFKSTVQSVYKFRRKFLQI